MTKKTVRSVVVVPPELSEDLRKISDRMGNSVSYVTRTGLRYVIDRINRGELAVVNGELKPV